MSRTKATVSAGLCIALGVLLPIIFHSVPNAGAVFLPMHIPVLLCGLVCGPVYGLACGLLTPLLSSLLTGMPPAAMLPQMLCELAVYGFVSGILMRRLRTGKHAADVWLSLVGAMLAGRLVYGTLNALIFRAGEYSLSVWLSAAFVTGLPGIAIQLVLIPPLVLALERSKLIPAAA